MLSRHAISAYRAALTTTPPLQAVVLLYDAALVRIHNAALAAAQGDYARQFDEVMRAQDVLRGLLASLDYRQGGDFACRLGETYEANMKALLRAVGRTNGDECCRRIADGLRLLRNAWAEVAGLTVIETQRVP